MSGKVVLVTRPREGGAPADAGIVGLLRAAGAQPLVVPTVVFAPPSDPGGLARAVERLGAGAARGASGWGRARTDGWHSRARTPLRAPGTRLGATRSGFRMQASRSWAQPRRARSRRGGCRPTWLPGSTAPRAWPLP